MTLTELENVKLGDPLGIVRYNAGGAIVDSTLQRGIAPESSSLATDDAETYVATDDFGQRVAVVALKHIHDGKAELGVESIDSSIGSNTELMRSVIRTAMQRNGVTVGTLDPELVDLLDVPPEQWQNIGFLPDDSGHYTFTGA